MASQAGRINSDSSVAGGAVDAGKNGFGDGVVVALDEGREDFAAGGTAVFESMRSGGDCGVRNRGCSTRTSSTIVA